MPINPVNATPIYFTIVEDHWTRHRRSSGLLSPQDWQTLTAWHDAGIPLAAVLRGMDAAFARSAERRKFSTSGHINALSYCEPQVLDAANQLRGARAGTHPTEKG